MEVNIGVVSVLYRDVTPQMDNYMERKIENHVEAGVPIGLNNLPLVSNGAMDPDSGPHIPSNIVVCSFFSIPLFPASVQHLVSTSFSIFFSM